MVGGKVVALVGADAQSYLDDVIAALDAVRLNGQYAPRRNVIAHLQPLDPRWHRGLYPSVRVTRRAGLPVLADWTRVKIDVAKAGEILEGLGPVKNLRARAGRAPIDDKQLDKHRYYSALVGRPTAALADVQVKLRRQDPARQRAHLSICFDKLDGSGVLVRYTIDLVQSASVWRRPIVQLDDDHAQATEALRAMVYRHAGFDAELTYLNLSALDDIEVERVLKTTIGPIYVASLGQRGPYAQRLSDGGAVIATFGYDEASATRADDLDNDPLTSALSDRLSPDAKAGYERARTERKFGLHRDRKFAVDEFSEAIVKMSCGAAGTKNVIYRISRRS